VIDLILGALCEVRSEAHQQAHGGLVADSAWHIKRGELPTCRPESDSDDDSDRGWFDRDKFGFGCSWRGCG
jgi:hypothetical protein